MFSNVDFDEKIVFQSYPEMVHLLMGDEVMTAIILSSTKYHVLST